MSRAKPLYPHGPARVPAGFTTPSRRYRLQVVVLLVSLMLFFLFYLGLVAGSAYLCYWAVVFPLPGVNKGTVFLKITAVGCSALLFLFLLKGLFKWRKEDKALQLEVKEEDQPELFAFIARLCDETGAPFPHRVFISPDVNAAVFYNSRSVFNLVLPTPKNLLIGLGLVNVLNLSEFKAVLAHEFGHFSQSSMKLNGYVYESQRIIADMVYGRDWLDDLLAQLKGLDIRLSFFVYIFHGIVWVLRKALGGCFQAITFFSSALSRQMEFNADLVAVSMCGSDAIVNGLARLDFANDALNQAYHELSAAADHKIYTRDLFFHQSHALSYLRRVRKDPKLGEPPPVPDDGEPAAVFEPGDSGIPLMWATHPPNYDREQNAKRHYLRCRLDERSPWLLFSDPPRLRERLSRRFYKFHLQLPRETPLTDAEEVQAFIDEEHAEMTYDEKYHGLYDGRFIELEDVAALADQVRAEPLPAARLAEAQSDLYGGGLDEWMKSYNERQSEHALLSGLERGELALKEKDFEFRGARYRAADVPKLLKKVDRELGDDRTRLADLDRKVFHAHYQMAATLDEGMQDQLVGRYRFHLGVQDFFRRLTDQQAQLNAVLQYLSSKREFSNEEIAEAVGRFREAHDMLAYALERSREFRIPVLKNMTYDLPLRKFLLEEDFLSNLPEDATSISGGWISQMMEQLGKVIEKLRRLHFKSLGGLLALQEEIRREWKENFDKIPEVVAGDEEPAATKE